MVLWGLLLILLILLLMTKVHFHNVTGNLTRFDATNEFIQCQTEIVGNITVIFNYNNGQNVTFSNLTLVNDITAYDATVMAIGKDNISEYWAINGVFIKGFYINNQWYMNNPSGQNWLYYVNGVLVPVSCSVLELQNHSIIEWRYTGGSPFSDDSSSQADFWLYFGIFLGVVALCISTILVIARKGFSF